MTKIDDGGSAFPGQRLGSDGLPESAAWDGMSLRDWFAGQALAMLADPKCISDSNIVALAAYQVADAMLAARKVEK